MEAQHLKSLHFNLGPKIVTTKGTNLSFHSNLNDDEYEHTDIIRKQVTSHSGSPDKMVFYRQRSIQD